jgi:RimJ/RimL family protein N-acetyltransferase
MITTERLLLREWRDDDAEPLARMHESPEMMRFLGGPLTRAQTDEMLVRMRTHWATRGFGVFALTTRAVPPSADPATEHEGHLVGMCGILVPRWESRFQPCVEILWRLHPDLWGRGLVTEAARAALKDGFETHHFEEVLAFTIPANERSWRVMERLGMKRSPDDDFDHPLVPEGDPHRRHMVYRLKRSAE